MYYLAEINLIFLFIALAGSITVDFAGYIDFNRKWTYSYQVSKPTTEISKSDTSKEISSEKGKIELKTTHKSRFSVTGHFKKIATKDSTTKKKNLENHLRQKTTTFSDENLEINIEDVTESVITSSSVDKDVKKPIISGKISLNFEKGETNKGLQQDPVIFSDENLEVNSQEHITESVLTAPSTDRGVKKPAVTSQKSTSFDDYDTTTENEKGKNGLQHDIKIFSDESLDTNSQESITESVLTSPLIGRGAKRPNVTNPMSRSLEDYDTITEKKKGQKGLQHEIATFSDENIETNSQESTTKSILKSPSIGRNAKRPSMTNSMSRSLEDHNTTTEKKKGQKVLQHDIKTFSDENLETNSEESITDSVLTSPSIVSGAKKTAATSQKSLNLDEDDATIKNKKHNRKQRHDMTTSSDEYSDQEYATESVLKSPSKDKDIEKSTTTGATNISVEDETTTKKKKRYKKHKKTSKKVVYESSSESKQDLDTDSLEAEITTSKKNKAKSKESESAEKYLDTTTENVFNTMRPQYFHEWSMSNISLHTIEDDPHVKYFIGHILRSALRIFQNLKSKTNSPTLAAKIDLLADKYVTRYNLFIDEVKKNKIKTRLGPQKVLLSAIDSSDQMMNRIVNYIVEDGSIKDSLRTSINVANEFKQAINKETEDKYTYICRMMNVCHSKSGFANFLKEYITIILLCDETKFAEAVKSFTEVTKKIDFNGTFDTVARLNILRAIKYIENQNLLALKTILKIIRNIIAYKNEPIIIHQSDKAINSTLAILEILEAFESKLLRSDANIVIWGDLRANLVGWAHHKRTDIHDTMNNFMFYLKTALDDMPDLIKKRIAHNIAIIMNRKPEM